MQVTIDGIEYTPRAKPYQCSFAEAVEFKRLNLGITRKEAARRCGISEHTLYDIERDAHIPRFDTAAQIALGLGLDISRLAETVLKNPLGTLRKLRDVRAEPLPPDVSPSR